MRSNSDSTRSTAFRARSFAPLEPATLHVVSHPSTVPINQAVYLRMQELGSQVVIAVPSRWRHPYQHTNIRPAALPGLEHALIQLPVALPGRPQRHIYLANTRAIVHSLAPSMLFIEAEPFSFAALQWGVAAHSLGIPFGVQAAENVDKSLPPPVTAYRSWLLRRARFVAARSPTAARLTRKWGARSEILLLPHAVPQWPSTGPPESGRPFTVGYAGRLVPEKGVLDLVQASKRMTVSARLLFVGDGPLRDELRRGGPRVTVLTDVPHAEMWRGYAQMDLLVLPSHTTRAWSEQFGRVLTEALACGVPVVGSSSGEIPWVIEKTQGGCVFPEGDVGALAAALDRLARNATERAQLARSGAAAVRQFFSVDSVATSFRELCDRVTHHA